MSKKKILLIIIALLAVIGVSYYFYTNTMLTTAEEETEEAIVLKVQKQDLTEKLSTTGVVQSSNVENVVSKITGTINAMQFEVGDEVNEGDLLAKIDDADIKVSIQDLKSRRSNLINQLNTLKSEGNIGLTNNLSNAQTAYDNALETYENNKKLFDVGSISMHELELSIDSKNRAYNDLQFAKTKFEAFNINQEIALIEEDINLFNTNIKVLELDLEETIILSPITGVVTSTHVEEGKFIQQNAKILEIENLETLEVEVFISEYDIAKVELDQEVTITPLGNREMMYWGRVTKIYPNAEIAGGESTVKVVISIENEDERLLANFNVALEIMINKVEGALVVPYEALVSLRNGEHGVMVKKNEAIKMIPVETGVRGDLHIQIISDEITEGMEVHLREINDSDNGNRPQPGFMPGGGGGGGGKRP